MNDFSKHFDWPGVQLHHYYIYFIIAALIAFYLVVRSNSKYKLELFFLSFYLLTGNINRILTFKLPGFGLLEIQPLRFVYLLLLFFIIRKTLLSRRKNEFSLKRKTPWFLLALFSYIFFLIISVVVNVQTIGTAELLESVIDSLAFLIIMMSLALMADKSTYDIIGKTIIIGAVLTSVISIFQLTVDPYFLRIGDNRAAFGGLLRSNGIFDTEYFNSYYLIIAMAWTLTTIRKAYLKIILVTLFAIGVLSSFQRMSWIIMALVLLTYLVYIEKVAIEKMILLGLTGLAIITSISILYFQDIKNSSLVRDRLSSDIDGRVGYYSMVFNNIGEKPLFGYGSLKNEVYYTNMLQITQDRDRASAETGDIHSGYFSALFLYGIPAFLSFTSFVVLSVIYYARAYRKNIYFIIPFLVSIIYMIGNLTNTFLFLKYIAVLYALHIGIGLGVNRIQEQTSST